MRKEWTPMQVKVVGQVREVVQGNRGKYSRPNGIEALGHKEPR